MANRPPPTDPDAYQIWVKQLEREWQQGLIPDPRAVAVILTNHRGEVLLQLRDDHPKISFAGSRTLPGGVVEADEPPAQAAKRELAEETGLDPRNKNVGPSFFGDQYWHPKLEQGVGLQL